ncbi:TPA: ABC transporter ATP-binding protein [Candidatus Peregrinibacteria bacterium]|nr:ABC transporter ATP-binding protein [Candidatus Peregrinibacteria bacterium]
MENKKIMKEILLQLKDVHVHFGGVKALDGVNVDINAGEVTALMGPNGAGKSTILKAVFGLAPVTSGSILWHNDAFKPIPYEVVYKGISFVPQGRRVFARLTVEENLEIGGFTVANKNELKERIARMMELFPVLKHKRREPSGSLSGGQQQMLAIARGLMTDPKVLLLDEPSLGLAPKIVKEVFEKIKEINLKQKTAIVVVEHNIKSLLGVADRVYVLDKGKVALHGNSDDIENSDIMKRVFLGEME